MTPSQPEYFEGYFQALTSNPPFPWQRALFERFIAPDPTTWFPSVCDVPTGLGKTAVMAVWLLALAHHTRAESVHAFPRRLVYVVNRRTVVDQSTREAEHLRTALQRDPRLQEIAAALRSLSSRPSVTDSPLAISTLRGQFADNAEWRDDPTRPAIVAGTVDMIGSRLLFSAYGRGFKSRPLHAAFLAQDVLIIHDEAHLEPAFQMLLEAIRDEQTRCNEFRRLSVVALSATSRTSHTAIDDRLTLTDTDREHPIVKQRLFAAKGLKFHPIENEKRAADAVVTLALRDEIRNSGSATVIFLRRVEDVSKVAERLRREGHHVQKLTGTLRGKERDELLDQPTFRRFLPTPHSNVQTGTVYLVCTSAGEVGVNISADHMICDLTPFDSMAQRLGRVNRFGGGNAWVDVVVPESVLSEADASDPSGKLQVALTRTYSLLSRLPERLDGRRDASPAALGDLPAHERLAAFTPQPKIPPTSDILFDAWALTTIRGDLPGRPPVEDWLHGVSDWEPPETHVAWRHEVECLTSELLAKYDPEELLEDYPLKPHELLRDRSSRVFAELKKACDRAPDAVLWTLASSGAVRVRSLADVIAEGEEAIARRTVILPPRLGGLLEGELNGAIPFQEGFQYDVADNWLDDGGKQRRQRVWDDQMPLRGMRLVRTLQITEDDDHKDPDDGLEPSRYAWRWFVRPKSADDDGSRTALSAQALHDHLASTERFAQAISSQLLSEPERSAVILAARWHDLGKSRTLWQRSIGNLDAKRVLAKSGPGMRPLNITSYRHEFGSLLDVVDLDEFKQLEPDAKDLVLHLIAAHHGRARPHFPPDEAFDPDRPDGLARETCREIPRRFARLQRKYGRWGLAFLESLVRAADALASQAIPADGADPSQDPSEIREAAE